MRRAVFQAVGAWAKVTWNEKGEAMKAVRYYGPDQPFRLEEVERRAPEAGEVLVQVTASGMCHTELHFKSGLLNLGVAPVTMGHEVVGRIVAIGDGVAPERIGERVIVYYYVGCGTCRYCRVGDEQLCPQVRAEYGFVSDGGYAEYGGFCLTPRNGAFGRITAA